MSYIITDSDASAALKQDALQYDSRLSKGTITFGRIFSREAQTSLTCAVFSSTYWFNLL